MKKFIALLCLLSFTLFCSQPILALESHANKTGQIIKVEQVEQNNLLKTIEINNGLIIPVMFTSPVSSNNVKDGDMVGIAIYKDIFVNNILVFKKGTQGVAFIEQAKPARAWGRAGSIQINSAKISDVFGNEHVINLQSYSKGNTSKAAVILPIVGCIIVWPLIFFAFKKGSEVSLSAGKLYNGFIITPISVNIS